MTNALSRRHPAPSALSRHTASPIDAGVGIDPATVNFSERMITFEELPNVFIATTSTHGSNALVLAGQNKTALRLPHSVPLAAHAEQQPGITRRGGVAYQVRRGWAAYASALILVEARRVLTPRADGRYAPDGPWELTRRETYAVERLGRSERTLPLNTGSADSTTDSRTAPADQGPMSTADQALAALPEAVRRAVRAAVPVPEHHMGVLARWVNGAGTRWEATLLRQDAGHAVVIVATRLATANTWTVRELRYALGALTFEEMN